MTPCLTGYSVLHSSFGQQQNMFLDLTQSLWVQMAEKSQIPFSFLASNASCSIAIPSLNSILSPSQLQRYIVGRGKLRTGQRTQWGWGDRVNLSDWLFHLIFGNVYEKLKTLHNLFFRLCQNIPGIKMIWSRHVLNCSPQLHCKVNRACHLCFKEEEVCPSLGWDFKLGDNIFHAAYWDINAMSSLPRNNYLFRSRC